MQIRRHSASYINNSILLCIVFLVCLVASPSINTQVGRYSYVSGNSGSVGKASLPVIQEGKAYLTSETSGNEITTNIEFSFLTNRNIQNFQNILQRVFNIVLPFAGFGLLVCCFGYFNRKRTRNKSIMATSFGGHAPPKIFDLNITN